VPEEINRKIVDHIADINLPYSDISREYSTPRGACRRTGSSRPAADVRGAAPLPAEKLGKATCSAVSG